MIRHLGVLVLAMSVLSACATIDSIDRELSALMATEDDDERVEPAFTLKASDGMPPLPRRKPKQIAGIAVENFEPEQLVGLDFDSTKALLGSPALQLEQPPAKIWAYNGGTCMFNLFFYPSVDDNKFRILTFEIMDGAVKSSAKNVDESAVPESQDGKHSSAVVRRCFADLLNSNPSPDAG